MRAGIVNQSKLKVVDRLVDIQVWTVDPATNVFAFATGSGRDFDTLPSRPGRTHRTTFDLTDVVSNTYIRGIYFQVEKFTNGTPFTLELVLEDKNIFSKRATYQIKQNQRGDKMFLGFSDEMICKEYFITIR